MVIMWQLILRGGEAALDWGRVLSEELTEHDTGLSTVIYDVYVSF